MKIVKKIESSIQYKIFTLFFILILITITIISLFSYDKSNKTIEKNLGEYTFQIVSQVNENIEFYIKEMENISNICNYNYNVQKYLKNKNPANDLERFKDANKITELLNNITSVREDITSVFIFGENGYVIRNKPYQKLKANFDINNYDWYKEAVGHFGSAVVSSPHKQDYINGSNNSVISLSRVITNNDSMESQGIILIDLNLNVIKDICSKIKLGKEGYVYVFDEKGNVVYHPDQVSTYSKIGKEYMDDILNSENGTFIKVIDGKKKLITFTTSKYTKWKTVGIASVDEIATGSREMRNYIIVIGIISLIFLFMAAAYISSKITVRIKELEQKMIEAEEGNFNISLSTSGYDEISRLSITFNKMMKRINELMRQIFSEQEEKRKYELKVLEAQINPHFLYNTLDSIIWMAEGNKNEDVITMVSSLAKLFRISLSKGKEIISAKEEIEHVKSYLVIQKIRYKSKLDYIIDVDHEIFEYRCIKLVLQPLVENSIYHGIKNKKEKGIIVINGRVEEGNLVFYITDNGVGITEEKISNILSGKCEKTNSNGIGVRNVNDRIKLYFGKEYGLSYKSEVGKGTTVEVKLPKLTNWQEVNVNERK